MDNLNEVMTYLKVSQEDITFIETWDYFFYVDFKGHEKRYIILRDNSQLEKFIDFRHEMSMQDDFSYSEIHRWDDKPKFKWFLDGKKKLKNTVLVWFY